MIFLTVNTWVGKQSDWMHRFGKLAQVYSMLESPDPYLGGWH